MPFIDAALRQRLDLPTNTPTLEDLHRAAAERDLQFDPHTMTLAPVSAASKPRRLRTRAAAKQDA
jgi:hypothetical protein